MMFFVNVGVRLTTVNDEMIGVLKEIAVMGVEIFSCGTYITITSRNSTFATASQRTVSRKECRISTK